MNGKKALAFAVLITSMALVSCKNDKKEETAQPTEQTAAKTENVATGDTSENALTWNGTYSGVTPCADCDGIETTIVLNSDKTFTKTLVYKGKGDGEKFEEKGSLTWNPEGTTVTLKSATGEASQYKVQEGSILMLDQEGKVITGPTADKYELKKVK